MHIEPEIQASFSGEQFAGQVEWDAIDINAQQLAQAHIAVRHQRKRCEEMLAELAVCSPWFSFLIPLKRERINQDRLSFQELDVVRAAVLK